MTCDDYRTGYLAGDDVAGYQAHLEGCPACRRNHDALADTRAALAEPAFWDRPGVGIVEDVVDQIAAAAAPRSRRGPSPRSWWWAVAAAFVVAAVIFTAGVLRDATPDWSVALEPGPAAPGATAQVDGWVRDSGHQVRFASDGLDPAPAGYVYELWFSSEGRHVSAGTFVAGDGVDLWSGVGRRDFPRLWVTLEPLDTDPTPSGVVVLDMPRG